jgi:hypothetical protein
VDLLERVGAYVGLAAFLGLAVLALLYFSQARDVRRLREWAGRAPERAVEQAERAAEVEQATEVAPATPAAAAAHSLPPTPLSQASQPKRRKPLRERVRNIHIPQLRYIGMAALGVLVLAGGAYGALQLTGDDGGSTAASSRKEGRERSRDRNGGDNRSANVNPAQVTVAVLNGTTVQGLAAQVGEEVRAGGFRLGTIGNAARIDQAGSDVLYRSGQQRAARAVANRLGIDNTSPVDSVNQEIAGGSFDVIVLVGSDRSG